MAQDWAKPFYHDVRWLHQRKNYMQAVVDTSGNILIATDDGYARKDGTNVPDYMIVPPGMCERCFQLGELTPAKVVHHIQHLTPENVNDPKISLAYDNLQRLCQDCHAEVHSGTTPSRVTFDESGNLIPKGNDTLRAMVMQLTETVDERRNIYRRQR